MTFSGPHEGELMGVPATGRGFSVQHIHVFRVADGKLLEHWANRDDLRMVAQLGLMPELRIRASQPARERPYWRS